MAAYNTITYNTHRYNTDIFYLALSEVMSESDTQIDDIGQALFDFLFLSEFLDVSITNIPLSETIRLADWLSIERNPTNNEWYD